MLITLHCELTYGLPDEIANTAGQVNSLSSISNTT